MARVNKGRQRIEMTKITNKSRRQITFSKRRSGLFKKASELCTLTDVGIALIVNSPGQIAHSFGHPSVKEIIDRYENVTVSPTNNGNNELLTKAARREQTENLIEELDGLKEDLDFEKMKKNMLKQKETTNHGQHWIMKSIDNMDEQELSIFGSELRKLRSMVGQHCEVMRKNNVEPMQQNVAMVQHEELMNQNTSVMQQNLIMGVPGRSINSMQSVAAVAQPTYGFSHNAVVPYDLMLPSSFSSSSAPPHVGSWNMNLGK